jgi:DNA-binding XRE family transcriptional regulator
VHLAPSSLSDFKGYGKGMEGIQLTRRCSAKPARFPNAIRAYRLQAGLSQQHLAALTGHTRSVVSGWERGRSLPTLPHAFQLARSLNTLCEALYAALYHPEREAMGIGA